MEALEPVAKLAYKSPRGWVHAVQSDLSSGSIKAEVDWSPQLTRPWNFIQKSEPVSALTGTFFSWESQKPVAEVLVDGQLVSTGRRGSIFAVRWDGGVEIKDVPFGTTFDWSPYKFGLRGAVRLISDGVIQPNPRAQRFRDPAIWGRAARTGVGITSAGKLIMAATASRMTLSEFGSSLRHLGAVNALSLDGGGSTMLYHDGRMIISTSRRLSSVVTLRKVVP